MTDTEPTAYLGYPIVVIPGGFSVHAPDGTGAAFTSMQTIRKWVRRHRRQTRHVTA